MMSSRHFFGRLLNFRILLGGQVPSIKTRTGVRRGIFLVFGLSMRGIPSPVLSLIGYSGKETYLANPLSLLQSLRILNRGRNLLDMLESPEIKIQQGFLPKGTPPCAVPWGKELDALKPVINSEWAPTAETSSSLLVLPHTTRGLNEMVQFTIWV